MNVRFRALPLRPHKADMGSLTDLSPLLSSVGCAMSSVGMTRTASPIAMSVAEPIRPESAIIDLNTATADELDTVPELQGHGFEIVRYRDEHGPFYDLRQLDEVPGMVDKWDGAEKQVRIG